MAAKSGYSEWQLWRIRDALSAYKAYEKAGDQRECGWPDIHQAILEETDFFIGKDLKVGAEALRKFVEGVPDDSKIGGRRFPDPDWARHAFDFLKHPDIDYLSEDELDEEDSDYRFALYLSRYLCEPERLTQLDADMPAGRYSSKSIKQTEYIVRELYLQPYAQEKVFKTTLVETYYPIQAVMEPFDRLSHEGRDQRQAYQTSPGWAVLDPDNKLNIWLKDEVGDNQQLSSVTGLWDNEQNNFSKGLILSESDSPFAPVESFTSRVHDLKKQYTDLQSRLISDFVLVGEDLPELSQEDTHG